MYRNGFALAIKKGGQVLRESQQDGRSTVFLPFESEYSVLVKNNNGRRAALRLAIDGMDVGSEFVIGSGSSLDLERFLLDGDLNRGRCFKFVRSGDSRVQDPDSPDNGIVRAELWLEREYPRPTMLREKPWVKPAKPWDKPIGTPISSSHGDIFTSSVSYRALSASDTLGFASDAGATVEGGESHQGFQSVHFGTKDYPSTVLELILRGSKVAVTVSNTRRRTCLQCGRSTRRRDKYCPECGVHLPDIIYA